MVDFDELATEILSVFDVSEFENCDLLNMILIATSELISTEINYPHPYTITRCINRVLGKNTRARRGTESPSNPVENEGEIEDEIQRCMLMRSHKDLFKKGNDLVGIQNVKDTKRTQLAGFKLNYGNVITLKETASLHLFIKSKKKDGGAYPQEQVSEAITNCIYTFHGELSVEDLEKEKENYKNNILNILIKAKYFEEEIKDSLVVPSSNRSATEVKYLEYLVKKAIAHIKTKSTSRAENLQELLMRSLQN